MVNFDPSRQKSENVDFDWILLSKAYKDLVEKIQKSYFSWNWWVMQSLKKNWLLVQKRHEEFGEFSPNHLKVQRFHFDGLFLSKVYEVWAKEIQRSYLSWHWIVMQNFYKAQPCGLKNDMRNWVNFHYEHSKSEKLFNDGLFLSKAYNVSARKFQRKYVSLYDTEGLYMQNLKENWLVAWKVA